MVEWAWSWAKAQRPVPAMAAETVGRAVQEVHITDKTVLVMEPAAVGNQDVEASP